MKTPPVSLRMLVLVALLVVIAGCSRKQNPAQAAQPATSQPAAAQPAATQPAATQSAANQPAAAQSQTGPAAPAPPPGPTSDSSAAAGAPDASGNTSPASAPVAQPVASIVVPKGSRLVVRMGQTIDVKHAVAGEHFEGTLAEPVVVDNTVAIPSGSRATGEILRAHRRGRFKGASVLELTLTRVNVHGTNYRVDTSDLTTTKKGKGKRSAALIGGGAGLGMLVGGVATGGVGLLVGGLAGGGAGTLGAAFTGNKDIKIPAESLLSFRLEHGLTLTPSAPAPDAP